MGQLSAALLEKQINVAEKTPGRLVIKLFQKINGKSGREAAVRGRDDHKTRIRANRGASVPPPNLIYKYN